MLKKILAATAFAALAASPVYAEGPIRPSSFAAASAPAAPQGRGARPVPPRSNVATWVLAAIGVGASGYIISQIASRGRRNSVSPN